MSTPPSLVVVSPRVAPGQLTRAAWTTLADAVACAATPAAAAHAHAVRAAGIDVHDLTPHPHTPRPPDGVDVLLCASYADGVAHCRTTPADDTPDAPTATPTTLDVVVGAADLPGAHVVDLVAVMDRLRSPGGCPWDAEQTHASLAPYSVEEAYELAEAIALGHRDDIADELGDVLLQVAFHARVAQDGDAPFDIDDVADRIVAKLRRRHPHVFADTTVTSTADVEANWETIKATEKPERTGPLDGIPVGMPPLERVAKTTSRLHRAGLAGAWERATHTPHRGTPAPSTTQEYGDDLLRTAVAASLAGVEVSAALRDALHRATTRLDL